MKYFDTHAHLNISPLLEKVDQIIDECVKHQILVNNVGVNIETSKLAIFQAKKYKNVFATVGIHPTEVDKTDINKTMQEIEKMLIKKKENKIIAIGETGFDLHYNKNNFDIQKAFFEKHLELAVKHKLPLILHIRDAFEQSIDILKKIPNKINVLIHCFDSTKENARQYNNMNFYVAFGGKITHNSKSYLLDAINEINSERILLETDSPWLPPNNHKNETNKPIYMIDTLKFIVEKLKINEENFRKNIFENSIKFFANKNNT